MYTSEVIIYVICMIIYSIFAVFKVRSFKSLGGGIIGSGCLIAGSFGIYFIVPAIAALLIGFLKLIVGAALIMCIIGALTGS